MQNYAKKCTFEEFWATGLWSNPLLIYGAENFWWHMLEPGFSYMHMLCLWWQRCQAQLQPSVMTPLRLRCQLLWAVRMVYNKSLNNFKMFMRSFSILYFHFSLFIVQLMRASSKLQDLSAGTPSTVGWPGGMGLTRERDSRLSLNELVS